MTQPKDYTPVLEQMCAETLQLLERLKQITTVGLVVLREQRKVPGVSNAQYCQYCSDLFLNGIERTLKHD